MCDSHRLEGIETVSDLHDFVDGVRYAWVYPQVLPERLVLCLLRDMITNPNSVDEAIEPNSPPGLAIRQILTTLETMSFRQV